MVRIRHLCQDQRGVAAVEYGLIVALIVLAMMAGLSGVASSTTNMWNVVRDAVAGNVQTGS